MFTPTTKERRLSSLHRPLCSVFVMMMLLLCGSVLVSTVARGDNEATNAVSPPSPLDAVANDGDEYNTPDPDNARYHIKILPESTISAKDSDWPASQLLRYLLVPPSSNRERDEVNGRRVKQPITSTKSSETTQPGGIRCGSLRRHIVDPTATSSTEEQFIEIGPEVSPLTRQVLDVAVRFHLEKLKVALFPQQDGEPTFEELLVIHNGDVDAAYNEYRSKDGISSATHHDDIDPLSEEVDGWQPMMLPNGTQYLCKIPSISDYYEGGAGSLRGVDDIVVDIAWLSEESVQGILLISAVDDATPPPPRDEEEEKEQQHQLNDYVEATATTTASPPIRSSLFLESLKEALHKVVSLDDVAHRLEVVSDLQRMRVSAQYLVAANRDKVEEAMQIKAQKRNKKGGVEGVSSSSNTKGKKSSSPSRDAEEPSAESIAHAIKQLTKGEKVPDVIRRVFERRLRDSRALSSSATRKKSSGGRKALAEVIPHTSASPLPSNCFQQNAGWWTYEYCFGQHVAEYHQERGQGEAGTGRVNVLGLGPDREIEYGAASDDIYYMTDSIRGPYFSSVYYNGTVCDKTLEQRAVEVRMYCMNSVAGRSRTADAMSKVAAAAAGAEQSPSADRLTALHISEPETCKYVLWVGSPHFCIDAIREIQEGPTVQINCRRMSVL